jgi:hypothetical protein
LDWNAIGAIGEIVGAAAVVVTLIYLTAQIRQNNRNLEESTSSAINQSFASLNSRISSDEAFADLFVRGREDINVLNPVELERFRAFVSDVLNLAVYVDGLQATHDLNSLHYDVVKVVGSLYHTYPGIRAVIDSNEPVTPRDLVQRFRTSTPLSYELLAQKDDSR